MSGRGQPYQPTTAGVATIGSSDSGAESRIDNYWTLALQTHTICGTNTHDQVPVYSEKTGLLSIVTEQMKLCQYLMPKRKFS